MIWCVSNGASNLICHLNEMVISLGAGMFLTEHVAPPHGIVKIVVSLLLKLMHISVHELHAK